MHGGARVLHLRRRQRADYRTRRRCNDAEVEANSACCRYDALARTQHGGVYSNGHSAVSRAVVAQLAPGIIAPGSNSPVIAQGETVESACIKGSNVLPGENSSPIDAHGHVALRGGIVTK